MSKLFLNIHCLFFVFDNIVLIKENLTLWITSDRCILSKQKTYNLIAQN